MTTSRKLSADEKSAFQKKEDTKKKKKKKKKKTPQLKKQLHKSSKCKTQTLSLSLSLSHTHTHTHTHTHAHTHTHSHIHTHTHTHTYAHTHTRTLITPNRPLVQTHQRSAFSAGCVKRAIKVYTEQLATTLCTTTVSRGAACHEAYEIKQKSGPAFQSQSLALLQHRSFLNLAARQKKGLGLIWSKDCTTYFSQTDVQSERRWVQKSS